MAQFKINDSQEKAFDMFLAKGRFRIQRGQEFCGLSYSDFVEFIVNEAPDRFLNGIIRSVYTFKSECPAPLLGAQSEELKTLFDKFMEANVPKFQAAYFQGLQAHQNEQSLLAAGY
ncbi:hypothetical protein [Vibrio sp. SCSIO 43136]|uniref:hypothetical protein n=1 Tax=Vibrio sp. SCSIO 43136 TaxID=2819101 RepID=UPI002075F967|nr:hypothetical protein [Vibrio sp. SCSIO 43136]USD64236.1 hypothetical protein J4N39_08945 [Vibrio sp. SCSIO 43136]